MNPGDKNFLMNMGVPEAQGVPQPKSYPFYVSETNPNPTGRCLCEYADTVGPYIVFPGDMLDVSSPRPVLCAGCVPCLAALLEGAPLPEMPEPVIDLPLEEVTEDDDPVVGL